MFTFELMDGINKNFRRGHRVEKSVDLLFEQITQGNLSSLAESITMVESSRREDEIKAGQLVEKCLPISGKSIRIGITGVPGVGKSTFIEAFGNYLTSVGKRVAVLAIDPSSQKSGGSILGDKTRMETLVQNPDVFVRPSPSRGSLGGVAKATRESIVLCEAAGYDVVIIETVGVGQSEIAVRGMVDFFLLLMLAGAGDELQGIKRGIMEMADALVITKADGDNVQQAKRAMAEYKNALHLFPQAESGWLPQVSYCSALKGDNIDKVYEMLENYYNMTTINGFMQKNRSDQAAYWMNERINELLLDDFKKNEGVQELLQGLRKKVVKNEMSPFNAAEQLLKKYRD